MAANRRSNNIVLALLILCIAAIACGSSTPQIQTADDYVKEYGGNADVYLMILSLTDCSALQEQFEIAFANNTRETAGTSNFKTTLGYITAADNRMKEIGCYGTSESSVVNTPPATSVPVQITIAEGSPTPFILPTLTKPANAVIYFSPTPINTIVFIMPTRAPTRTGEAPPPLRSADCSCAADNLNCADFSTWYDAQSCMDKCVSIGKGDIYHLDADNDGLACENLP